MLVSQAHQQPEAKGQVRAARSRARPRCAVRVGRERTAVRPLMARALGSHSWEAGSPTRRCRRRLGPPQSSLGASLIFCFFLLFFFCFSLVDTHLFQEFDMWVSSSGCDAVPPASWAICHRTMRPRTLFHFTP